MLAIAKTGKKQSNSIQVRKWSLSRQSAAGLIKVAWPKQFGEPDHNAIAIMSQLHSFQINKKTQIIHTLSMFCRWISFTISSLPLAIPIKKSNYRKVKPYTLCNNTISMQNNFQKIKLKTAIKKIKTKKKLQDKFKSSKQNKRQVQRKWGLIKEKSHSKYRRYWKIQKWLTFDCCCWRSCSCGWWELLCKWISYGFHRHNYAALQKKKVSWILNCGLENWWNTNKKRFV